MFGRRRHAAAEVQAAPVPQLTDAQILEVVHAKIAELIDSKQGLAARALDGSDVEIGSADSVQLDALIHLLEDALGE